MVDLQLYTTVTMYTTVMYNHHVLFGTWLVRGHCHVCGHLHACQGVPGILLTDPIMDFDLKLYTMIHHGEM
jgi:hypothetical protein